MDKVMAVFGIMSVKSAGGKFPMGELQILIK
jgi:hypothetical protein